MVTVDRGRYTVLVDDVEVNAMRARELGRKGIAVGDVVHVVGDLSGTADALARVVRIAERSTVVRSATRTTRASASASPLRSPTTWTTSPTAMPLRPSSRARIAVTSTSSTRTV